MTNHIDGKYIETTAKHMGLEFVRETKVKEYNAHMKQCKWRLDPDVVYLFEPGVPTHSESHNGNLTNQCRDAVLHYNDKILQLSWNNSTKAHIRKILQSGGEEPECAVCYESSPLQCHSCPQCGSKVCAFCQVKMCLTPETISLVLRGSHITIVHCVECRGVFQMDLMQTYYMLFDRLTEFAERQQEALLFLKNSDPEFQTNFDRWNRALEAKREDNIKRFKTGCRVKIHGLKKARKWNGKAAVIVGAKVIKSNVIRWPVQLSDGSHSKALLRGVNMKKV